MKKNYTIETRLRLDKEQRKYLKEYIIYYNAIYRYVWKRMNEPDFKKKHTKISIFVTEICNKFKILKRTVNTIRKDVQGRIEALTELKKLEKRNLENKINAVSDEMEKLKEKINLFKTKIEKNEFRKNRDKNIGYLGSSDETCGNQMFQMRYDKETDTFCIKIRKEKKWENEEKYLEIENVDFKYNVSSTKKYEKIILFHYNIIKYHMEKG